jgi:hypothetical protein
VENFLPVLQERLPETSALLAGASLSLHPAVERVVLSGSRGLRGGFRPESDVDLALIVEREALPEETDARAAFLRGVLHFTLDAWRGPVDVDLAALFDLRGCGLPCTDTAYYAAHGCPCGGVSPFGLFKIQRGFDGFVSGPWLLVEKAQPMLTIWRR